MHPPATETADELLPTEVANACCFLLIAAMMILPIPLSESVVNLYSLLGLDDWQFGLISLVFGLLPFGYRWHRNKTWRGYVNTLLSGILMGFICAQVWSAAIVFQNVSILLPFLVFPITLFLVSVPRWKR